MKIFSNFDTELGKRLHQEAIEKYGEDNALFIRRSPIYMYINVYIPIFFWLLFSSILALLFYSNIEVSNQTGVVLAWMLWIFIGITGVYLFFVLTKKYIDYRMDYLIITPRQVIAYDQEGVLDRLVRSLDLAKIKSINVKKVGFFGSLFNYGNIVFFAEGDHQNGDIRMNFLSNPVELKNKISVIIDTHYTMQGQLQTESL